MNTISVTLNTQQITQLLTAFKPYISNKKINYVKHLIILTDCRITIYTSNKVVFQGQEAEFYAAQFMPKTSKKTNDNLNGNLDLNDDTAGSDECGTGDFFGPVVVCACIVRKSQIAWVKSLKVDDSKKLTDKYIMQIAPSLKEKLEHNCLILGNLQYNQIYGQYNLNGIKAVLHNQVYLNLNKQTTVPKKAFVDQFTTINSYFRYLKTQPEIYQDLYFETKAESKYLAVACASIIARYEFVKSFENMQKHYGINFHKGANNLVIEDAKSFVKKFGSSRLNEVAKMNFKTLEKVL